jgi:hypothetical protein
LERRPFTKIDDVFPSNFRRWYYCLTPYHFYRAGYSLSDLPRVSSLSPPPPSDHCKGLIREDPLEACHAHQDGESERLVDLRFYCFKWYGEDLTLLPDRLDKKYAVEYKVLSVNKKFITAYSHAFNETWKDSSGTHCFNSYWCYAYGSCRIFDASTMVLIDPIFVQEHPWIYSKSPESNKIFYRTSSPPWSQPTQARRGGGRQL